VYTIAEASRDIIETSGTSWSPAKGRRRDKWEHRIVRAKSG